MARIAKFKIIVPFIAHVITTNDRYPRAINPRGTLKRDADWHGETILLKEGASIGARTVILPGVTIGKFALVGAGSVVTKTFPDYALVMGHPARMIGYVCACGKKLEAEKKAGDSCAGCRAVKLETPPAGKQSLFVRDPSE